jgi:hypothetical protein
MSIVIQDTGELVYGGLVTLTEWWDTKRVNEGSITKKQLLKQAHFYTYVVIGVAATVVSAFHLWSSKESWMEHVSHGFIYDLPRQIFNGVQSLRTPPGASTTGDSQAVREARAILARKTQEAARARVNQDLYVAHNNPQPMEMGATETIVQPQSLYGGRGELG